MLPDEFNITHRVCSFREMSFDLKEVYHLMGYKNCEPDGEIASMIETVYTRVQDLCAPQYLYKIYPGKVHDRFSVKIGGELFRPGKTIVSYLEETERFCVFVTTAGREYEEYKDFLKKSGNLPEEFIADAIGSVIAEACVTKLSGELDLFEGWEHTYPYSPGYCGWKLTEQHTLFSLLPDKPCGISLTESSLMLPVKSISGIMGLGRKIERKAYGCTLCENINCYKRRETNLS